MKTHLRRDFVRSVLFGFGGLGLRALATGLPPALLLNPREALASGPGLPSQFLLLATSSTGDPVNAYAPGSYLVPNISRSTNANMAKASVQIAGQAWDVAAPWATLPQSFYDRACFFHHATETIGHGDDLKVLGAMGAVRRGENFIALFSRYLQTSLGTVSPDPVPTDQETLTSSGMPLARVSPLGLQTSLLSAPGPLMDLRPLRDKTLDTLNAIYKAHGTVAQKAFLDQLASSQTQARSISDDVLNGLSALNGNDVDNEILAAILLFKLKITPVVAVHLSFGGDNHSDPNLLNESNSHQTAAASLNKMLTTLQTWGLTDNVTFALLNVFGRTLLNSASGRGHNGGHNVGILMGKNVSPGVVGGLVLPPSGTDYVASAFSSTTGASSATGDVTADTSLAAFAYTLGGVLGIPSSFCDTYFTSGTVVKSAVVGA